MPHGTSDWRPPFCPHPTCRFHADSRGWRFKKNGTHFRQVDRCHVQRYRCHHCRRSFSSQTFSTTYWLKRPDLLIPITHGLLACSGFRQIARGLAVSPTTVERQAARLGRHMLLFHEARRPRTPVPAEPLIYDGFETFEYSQYWPTHLNTVVGATSQFVYATTVCELRRKGRHTPAQRARRDALETRYGRPDPRAIERTTVEALELAVPALASPEGELEPPSSASPGAPVTVVLRTDEHPAYRRALRRLAGGGVEFQHETTSSKAARIPQNPLHPVNTLHALMRHSGANHKRETIAWSKRRQSMLWRDCVHRVWRNWVKRISERGSDETPAMRLGLAHGRLRWRGILGSRLFVTRIALQAPLDRYYWGREPTRQIPNAHPHTLRLAF